MLWQWPAALVSLASSGSPYGGSIVTSPDRSYSEPLPTVVATRRELAIANCAVCAERARHGLIPCECVYCQRGSHCPWWHDYPRSLAREFKSDDG